MKMKRTYSQKPADVSREWYQIDAAGMPLGRLATRVATLLTGKGKPTYTPHVDGGDHVIIINADKVVLTGRKGQEFKYRYSGFPGGISKTLKSQVISENPARAVTQAVAGMIPTNKLQSARLARLRVYAGTEHEHAAQKPKVLES